MTGNYDFPAHIAEKTKEAHARIDVLSGRVTALEKDGAVAAERVVGIQTSLVKIENSISRVVWLIITAIVGAIITFLIKGGFHVL